MLKLFGSVEVFEEYTLKQKHSQKVKTDWSYDAHKCDWEGDAEVEYAGVEVCVGNLILGGKALNLMAVIAKVYLPFRLPHVDADARTVQMQLLFEGIGTHPGIAVAE